MGHILEITNYKWKEEEKEILIPKEGHQLSSRISPYTKKKIKKNNNRKEKNHPNQWLTILSQGKKSPTKLFS